MSGLHDRPDVIELVAAVREFLEQDVLAATEGRVQFHTRVSINALHMVERELAERDAMEAAHAVRLRQLGVTSDEELSAAIQDGQFDDRWEELSAAVYESVIEKLRVANPDYLLDDEAEG
ncbi:MAG TPA: DUF6285 domain-containing protein [Acidimicrobiia bacterium]|nr:DUF6285 domain-containing protein [Acidimicrobiia bacterium]